MSRLRDIGDRLIAVLGAVPMALENIALAIRERKAGAVALDVAIRHAQESTWRPVLVLEDLQHNGNSRFHAGGELPIEPGRRLAPTEPFKVQHSDIVAAIVRNDGHRPVHVMLIAFDAQGSALGGRTGTSRGDIGSFVVAPRGTVRLELRPWQDFTLEAYAFEARAVIA